jgi:hypothetical protein
VSGSSSLAGSSGTAPASGLLFWNKLGTEEEVAESVVGPAGSVMGPIDFQAGLFGGAAEFRVDRVGAITFEPAQAFIRPEGGAVEFWARLVGFQESLPWGPNPVLFQAGDGRSGYHLSFNCNDGGAGGGLIAVAGNNRATSRRYDTCSAYSQVIGTVLDWHHYALAWSPEGVPGTGGQVVAAYVDGRLDSTIFWDHNAAGFLPLEGGLLELVPMWSTASGTLLLDNIKSWGFPKTDYADRFTE